MGYRMLDTIKSNVVKKALNALILKDIGELTHLRIDPDARTIDIELMLDGETKPLHVTVAGYRLAKGDDGTYLSFTTVKCSRAWLRKLIERYAAGKPLKVPGVVCTVL